MTETDKTRTDGAGIANTQIRNTEIRSTEMHVAGIRLDVENVFPGDPSSPERTGARVELERFLAAESEPVASALGKIRTAAEEGRLGFLDLPADVSLADRTDALARDLRSRADTLVVLGIGGSGLGARSISDALRGPMWTEAARRRGAPRIYVVDNPDPSTLERVLEGVDPASTVFNVVSKSGSTVETLAQYLVVREWIRERLGDDALVERFVFTTDPDRGPLRDIAAETGVPTLPVPASVGGRFSVLSPVGLLPAAFLGLDTPALLSGARRVADESLRTPLPMNLPAFLAVSLHRALESGRSVHVMMPYLDRLRSFAQWFQQLWAESLAKAVDRRGRSYGAGPTPLAASGPVDQHSLLQLLMEGPPDKVVLFLGIEEEHELRIPLSDPGHPALRHLAGHRLSSLLVAEREATAEALRRIGCPNLALTADRLDETRLGALYMIFELATVLAAELAEIDPLDQPGVELSKQLIRERLAADSTD